MMVDHLLIGEITVYEQDPGTSTMPDISGSEVRPDILDIVGMFFFWVNVHFPTGLDDFWVNNLKNFPACPSFTAGLYQ